MTALRSLAFNGFAFVWTALIFVVCLPLLAAPRRWLRDAAGVWISGLLAGLRALCGLSHEVRGRENLPNGPCILASKHQSAWDTVAFHHIQPNAVYVLKRELMHVPLFGWYLRRTGNVPVDRAGGSKALKKMIADAEAAVAAGYSILIFPEGTRTAPGQRRDYHPGVAALYRALDLPVVPVAVNSGVYWPRRSFRKKPGRIVLEILPPIEAGLDRRSFMERLRHAIEEASDRLMSEAGRTNG